MSNSQYVKGILVQTKNPSWPWPNFTASEIACKCGCNEVYVDPESMDALQDLRDVWGKPIVLTSAHRCTAHNAAVGGAANSRHLTLAFDCAVPAVDQDEFVALAEGVGFTGIGTYPKRGFVHLDMGPRRRWQGK